MKEKVYDEQINPLMAQILEICKANKIGMIADFRLDDDMHCTSALLDDEYDPSEAQLIAFNALKPRRAVAFAETTTTEADGSKRISIRRIS